MKLISPFVSSVLIPLIISLPLPARAAISAEASGDSASSLQIRVTNPEPGHPTGVCPNGFLINVADANNSPVVDAAVALRLPSTDPTGVFSDGSHSTVAYTGKSGSACVTGMRWTASSGEVEVRVTATKGSSHAGILVIQPLGPPAPAELPVSAPALSEPVLVAPTPAGLPMPPPPPPLAEVRTPKAARPVPGTLAPAAPIPHVQISVPREAAPKSDPPLASPEPSVSVTHTSASQLHRGGKAKWILIAAVAVGAAAGAGLAMKGKSSSGGSSAAGGLTVGSPSVSIGHP
jgi:hypothetical protein